MIQQPKWNKFLAILLSVVMVVTLAPVAAAAADSEEFEAIPLGLVNGDFEGGVVNGRPEGWKYWRGSRAEGLSVSQEVYQSGSRSMKLHREDFTDLGVESIKVPVKEGALIRASGSVYVENITGTDGNPGGNVNFWVRFFADEADPTPMPGDIKTVVKGEDIPTKQWVDLSVQGIVPSGAKYAIIFIYVYRDTAFEGYYDDIEFVELAVQQPDPDDPTVPHNAGFELPPLAGTIPGWSTIPNPPDEDQSVTISQEQAASGMNSLKLIDWNANRSLSVLSEMIDVEPGKGYAASAKVYLESGGASVYLKFYDAANKEIASSSQGAPDLPQRWLTVRTENIAPEGAVKARVLLYSGVASKDTTAFFDDVTFEEIPVLDMPYEFGEPVSLGVATMTAQTAGMAIGNNEIYFGASGTPATFYAIDALTGEVMYSEPFRNDDVIWAVTVGSDGNAYLAGTNSGDLVRYNRELKKLEYVGKNPSNQWVWDLDASEDGKIYGSTYPDSKAFVYDIATGTFTDYGTIHEGQDYVRGGGVVGDYFYAGIGINAYLYRIHRETGEKEELPLPIRTESTSVSNIWGYGGKLFVAYGTSLIIMDEETFEVYRMMDWQEPDTFDGQISPPSPYDPDLIYYRNKNTSELWTYNLATNEIGPVLDDAGEPVLLPVGNLKAMNWVERDGRQVLAMGSADIEFAIYDPLDHRVESFTSDVAKNGIDIQSMEFGDDGKLYMGGYQAAFSIYDAVKGEFIIQEDAPDQIEGIGFLNGNVYLGTYGGAVIWKYDPNEPFELGTNPHVFYDIQDGQSRPFTFTSGENKLFVGTIADYGLLGGALSVYDETTGEWSVHRHVVHNQSIVGLAYHNGKVFGGTTLTGGLGIEPTETVAKMFEWDAATNTKVSEFVPNLPGITPKMIGELSIGPDGNLYGIVWGKDSNTEQDVYSLFVMNPDTKEIVRSAELTSGATGSTWRPFFMRWGDDGLLYTTIGRYLTVFDPVTLAYKKLVSPHVHLMEVGPDGSIYYASDSLLMKIPVRMSGVTLTAEDNQLQVGESIALEVSLQLVNGKTGNADGTQVTYTVSDPSVAVVEDGKLVALSRGTVTVTTTVVQDAVTLTSEPITVEVIGSDVTVSDVEFTNSAGEPVTKLPKGDFILASMTVTNHTAEEREVVMMAGLYNKKNELEYISIAGTTIGPRDSDRLQAGFTLPNNIKSYTMKIHLYDNLEDRNPLAEPIIISGE